jgi:hypothetical protein
MKTIRTIDITPSPEEVTRIYAWILGHQGSTPMVLADYWAPTEDESVRIREAYAIYKGFMDLADKAHMNATASDKKKWARAALKKHGFFK